MLINLSKPKKGNLNVSNFVSDGLSICLVSVNLKGKLYLIYLLFPHVKHCLTIGNFTTRLTYLEIYSQETWSNMWRNAIWNGKLCVTWEGQTKQNNVAVTVYLPQLPLLRFLSKLSFKISDYLTAEFMLVYINLCFHNIFRSIYI
jgi:hypothetical protein